MADLSWDDFRFAKAIAETRSLGGAAERLGVNHSTVFRRLAERMGEDIVAFERKATGHDLRPSGELRITTNDTLFVHLLSDVLAAFRRAYAEIILDVVVANEVLNLSKRDADVAVRATDRPPEALIGRRVAEIGWAIFGPAQLAGQSFDPLVDARARGSQPAGR